MQFFERFCNSERMDSTEPLLRDNVTRSANDPKYWGSGSARRSSGLVRRGVPGSRAALRKSFTFGLTAGDEIPHMRPTSRAPFRRGLCSRAIAFWPRRDAGGMSRAAKGGDCKSPGYAFVGSSPTSPTIFLRRAPPIHERAESASMFHGNMNNLHRNTIGFGHGETTPRNVLAGANDFVVQIHAFVEQTEEASWPRAHHRRKAPIEPRRFGVDPSSTQRRLRASCLGRADVSPDASGSLS